MSALNLTAFSFAVLQVLKSIVTFLVADPPAAMSPRLNGRPPVTRKDIMSTIFIWLLLVVAATAFLSFDILMARNYYRSKRSNGDNWPNFLRWWINHNKGKLLSTGVVLMILSLALFLQDRTLNLPHLPDWLPRSKKAVWGLGVALAIILYVAFDGFMARRFYDGTGRGEISGRAFSRWWIRKSALKFTVVSVLGCTLLVGAWGVNRYRLLKTGSETFDYLENARQYFRQKKYREASIELRNTIQKNPKDYEAYLWLARCLMQMRDGNGARDAYHAALRIEPTLYAAHLGLAKVSLALKSPDEALKEAEQALNLAPRDAEPHLLLAVIHADAGRMDKALEQCRAAAGGKITSPEIRNQLVSTLVKLRAYPEALQAAEAGLRENPHDIQPAYMKARILMNMNRSGEVETLLRRLIVTDGTPVAHLELGKLKYSQKMYTEALNEFDEALRLAPDNESIMNDIASVNAEHGFDMERTVHLAARIYARRPDNPLYADTLGWTLYRQGKVEQALPLLRQASAEMPGFAVHHYHLGTALLKSGMKKAGRQELEIALKISGNFDGAEGARRLLAEHR